MERAAGTSEARRTRLKRLMAELESNLLAPLPGEAGALDRKVPAPRGHGHTDHAGG